MTNPTNGKITNLNLRNIIKSYSLMNIIIIYDR